MEPWPLCHHIRHSHADACNQDPQQDRAPEVTLAYKAEEWSEFLCEEGMHMFVYIIAFSQKFAIIVIWRESKESNDSDE